MWSSMICINSESNVTVEFTFTKYNLYFYSLCILLYVNWYVILKQNLVQFKHKHNEENNNSD
jgi:hypothetical protein